MRDWLITILTHHQYLVYGLIIFIAFVEGPILSVLLGLLLRLGYFSVVPVYIALMVGDLLGDVAWYYLGYHYGYSVIRKFGRRFGITEMKVARVEKMFHNNKNKILFISKITNGFGLAIVTLTTAGIVRIPFRRFVLVNFSGQIFWTGLLLSLGYFFGDSYEKIDSILGKSFLVGGFIILLYFGFRYSRNVGKKLQAHAEEK